ncbi:hypothetical protein BDD12DRAFT_764421 [Trichophaea hybrida]|nr:hypothetical protein BDD12DRAFT_764421 [Trichophaea hybrida]
MTPVILITGASRGLGAAIVSYLLERSSAKLVLVSRNTEALQTIKSANPHRVDYLATDVAAADAPANILERIKSAFGRLDSVIVNHGVLEPVAKIADTDIDAWRDGFNINFFAVVALVKEAIPELKKTRGRVLFVSSGAAVTPYLAWGAYGASKAAMNHLCSTLAAEEPDLAIISIRPGVIDTQMQADIRTKHKNAMGEENERFQALHREGKLLRPDQPGNVIARLALDMKKELSGQFLSWNAEQLKEYQEA